MKKRSIRTIKPSERIPSGGLPLLGLRLAAAPRLFLVSVNGRTYGCDAKTALSKVTVNHTAAVFPLI